MWFYSSLTYKKIVNSLKEREHCFLPEKSSELFEDFPCNLLFYMLVCVFLCVHFSSRCTWLSFGDRHTRISIALLQSRLQICGQGYNTPLFKFLEPCIFIDKSSLSWLFIRVVSLVYMVHILTWHSLPWILELSHGRCGFNFSLSVDRVFWLNTCTKHAARQKANNIAPPLENNLSLIVQ